MSSGRGRPDAAHAKKRAVKGQWATPPTNEFFHKGNMPVALDDDDDSLLETASQTRQRDAGADGSLAAKHSNASWPLFNNFSASSISSTTPPSVAAFNPSSGGGNSTASPPNFHQQPSGTLEGLTPDALSDLFPSVVTIGGGLMTPSSLLFSPPSGVSHPVIGASGASARAPPPPAGVFGGSAPLRRGSLEQMKGRARHASSTDVDAFMPSFEEYGDALLASGTGSLSGAMTLEGFSPFVDGPIFPTDVSASPRNLVSQAQVPTSEAAQQQLPLGRAQTTSARALGKPAKSRGAPASRPQSSPSSSANSSPGTAGHRVNNQQGSGHSVSSASELDHHPFQLSGGGEDGQQEDLSSAAPSKRALELQRNRATARLRRQKLRVTTDSLETEMRELYVSVTYLRRSLATIHEESYLHAVPANLKSPWANELPVSNTDTSALPSIFGPMSSPFDVMIKDAIVASKEYIMDPTMKQESATPARTRKTQQSPSMGPQKSNAPSATNDVPAIPICHDLPTGFSLSAHEQLHLACLLGSKRESMSFSTRRRQLAVESSMAGVLDVTSRMMQDAEAPAAWMNYLDQIHASRGDTSRASVPSALDPEQLEALAQLRSEVAYLGTQAVALNRAAKLLASKEWSSFPKTDILIEGVKDSLTAEQLDRFAQWTVRNDGVIMALRLNEQEF